MAKKTRRGRLPPVRSPRSVERALSRKYIALIEEARVQIMALVENRLSALYAQAGIRTDAHVDELRALIRAVDRTLDRELPPNDINAAAATQARQTATVTGAQAASQTKRLFGIDVFQETPRISELTDAFISDNVSLIKSIRGDLSKDVEGIISRALRSGVRNESLAKELNDRFDVGKSRARLIARDQVGSLTAQITRERHKTLGLDSYIWRTAADERVRSRHRFLDGKTFSYDNPPPSGTNGERLNPGEPINCRCWAEPVLPEEFDDE